MTKQEVLLVLLKNNKSSCQYKEITDKFCQLFHIINIFYSYYISFTSKLDAQSQSRYACRTSISYFANNRLVGTIPAGSI